MYVYTYIRQYSICTYYVHVGYNSYNVTKIDRNLFLPLLTRTYVSTSPLTTAPIWSCQCVKL